MSVGKGRFFELNGHHLSEFSCVHLQKVVPAELRNCLCELACQPHAGREGQRPQLTTMASGRGWSIETREGEERRASIYAAMRKSRHLC